VKVVLFGGGFLTAFRPCSMSGELQVNWRDSRGHHENITFL
jgi:hypothetical protein